MKIPKYLQLPIVMVCITVIICVILMILPIDQVLVTYKTVNGVNTVEYVSKAAGYTKPNEYVFEEDKQFVFESIMYSAMTLYTNGGASRTKLAESHKRWEAELARKNEEKLSRTQELNTAKVQALKELGYTEINENNATEVFEKIAEIQSRKTAFKKIDE